MTEPAGSKSPGYKPARKEPAQDGSISWSSLLREAVGLFERAGVENPAGSARRIVEAATGLDPTDLALNLEQPATVRGVAQFDAMVARRLKGEPLQYVVGSWGFRHLDLLVDRRVLIPRPETEEIVQWGLDELARCARSGSVEPLVADLGTGSGAIGLSVLTEVQQAQVWMTDASDDALAVCRANLAALGRAGVRGRIVSGSWFEALPDALLGAVDLIITNPPYVAQGDELPPVVADWEPNQALVSGPLGTEDVHHLLETAPRWLSADGAIVVEMAPDQVDPMCQLASAHFEEVESKQDLSDRQRGIVARFPRKPHS